MLLKRTSCGEAKKVVCTYCSLHRSILKDTIILIFLAASNTHLVDSPDMEFPDVPEPELVDKPEVVVANPPLLSAADEVPVLVEALVSVPKEPPLDCC